MAKKKKKEKSKTEKLWNLLHSVEHLFWNTKI